MLLYNESILDIKFIRENVDLVQKVANDKDYKVDMADQTKS